MKRVLVITDVERAAVRKLVEFASLPENHYHPIREGPVPGADQRFVLHLGLRADFRCVFTLTHSSDGLVWRHLSVSVPTEGMLPHPAMVTEIAHLFGFIGELKDWIAERHNTEACVIVAQRFSDSAS